MRYLAIFVLLLVQTCACAFAADLTQLTAKANSSDAAAQYKLGMMYGSGDGVQRDLDQAFGWFQKAARSGHPGAMYNLGVAYYNGTTLGATTPADVELAWIWFALAGENGDPAGKAESTRVWNELRDTTREHAQIRMADMFAKGVDVPVNGQRAVEILKGAPLSLEAQLKLAQIYLDGKIVPRDLAAARQQCEPLAQMKHAAGFYCMALIAEMREPPDAAQAAKNYEEAALRRDPRAMYKVAQAYATGSGMQKDPLKAYMWAFIAARMKYEPARLLAVSLELELSEKQVERSRKDALRMKWVAGGLYFAP